MDLILWRHAEAEEAAPGGSDMERQLTARGEKQALRMAQWLERQLPESTRILSSPARRCEQTVLCLGRKYKARDELSPDGQAEQLLSLVNWPNQKTPTLLVGHQPWLGQVLSLALGQPEAALSVRKGAVWWLRSRQREGQWQTVLMCVQSPEFL
ncbi:MAG: phosphohistidine phosphatase SixA [Betaproteobacteria bacterium]|nr:phosphohistidine phosphatase SixA [Betaproteobacteria bacterium]NBY04529.1 phosphohistidine phosphatase SixA [Betaproteobacteria bacterium]